MICIKKSDFTASVTSSAAAVLGFMKVLYLGDRLLDTDKIYVFKNYLLQSALTITV